MADFSRPNSGAEGQKALLTVWCNSMQWSMFWNMQRKTKWQPVGICMYFCLRYQSTTAVRHLEFPMGI